jgi:hypothetical protein
MRIMSFHEFNLSLMFNLSTKTSIIQLLNLTAPNPEVAYQNPPRIKTRLIISSPRYLKNYY